MRTSTCHALGMIALSSLVAAACSSSSEKASGTALVTKELGRQDVGPAGGTVTGGAVTIEIPAGALTTTRSIVIGEVISGGAALPSATQLAGSLYAFSPDDVDFKVPVTVTVKLDESKKRADGKGAVVLFRAASNTVEWRPYGADETSSTTLVGKTTHFSQWAPTAAAETACFRNQCAPIQPPGPPDPSKLPGFDCTLPASGPGVHCAGMGPDKGPPYVCSCVGSDIVLGSYQRLPPDTFVTAMAAQCGAVCPKTGALACDLGLSCDGSDTGGQWSCSVTREPGMLCNYVPGTGTSCTCKSGTSFSLPNFTTKPANDDLLTAWEQSCGGVCDGATNPADAFVCPGTVEYPNKDGGAGCVVETAGTCRDNHFYGYECDGDGSTPSACTCKVDGAPNGKVVPSGLCVGYDVWTACGFPKQQGQP